MPTLREPSSAGGFGRRLTIETPEHVVLRLELAGIGSRAAAALLYGLVLLVAYLAIVLLAGFTGRASAGTRVSPAWVWSALIIMFSVLQWGYFALFEGLARGRTPGKRVLGIRAVMDSGYPITVGAAVTRNLLRIVDLQPGITGLVGLLFIFLHPEHRRLGDLVAGTIVVRERADEPAAHAPGIAGPAATTTPPAPAPAGPAARLTDDEFRLLEQFLERADALDAGVRARFVDELVTRFGDRFPDVSIRQPLVFLRRVLDGERAARTGLTGATAAALGPRRPAARGMRFATRKAERWDAFRQEARRIETGGLARLAGAELRGFAARYREVAADLARARTYGVDAATVEALERAVAAGHNALYGARRIRRVALFPLMFRVLPAAVVRGGRYVLVALAVFLAPAVAGYAMVRQRPAVVYEIMPDVMLARAASGQRERAAGRGYGESPSPFLPVVATGIIANNVQVAIGAFAFGIAAGVGTVFLLVMNGLFFGSSLALFANAGLATWILTFVVGHGSIELTAIFIAGGAGLRIARAVLAPGDLSRRDALVAQGREALKMVGAAASLLLVAGTIEGFLSASDAPPALKLSVGAASVVLVTLYLLQGVNASRTAAESPSRAT